MFVVFQPIIANEDNLPTQMDLNDKKYICFMRQNEPQCLLLASIFSLVFASLNAPLVWVGKPFANDLAFFPKEKKAFLTTAKV